MLAEFRPRGGNSSFSLEVEADVQRTFPHTRRPHQVQPVLIFGRRAALLSAISGASLVEESIIA